MALTNIKRVRGVIMSGVTRSLILLFVTRSIYKRSEVLINNEINQYHMHISNNCGRKFIYELGHEQLNTIIFQTKHRSGTFPQPVEAWKN